MKSGTNRRVSSSRKAEIQSFVPFILRVLNILLALLESGQLHQNTQAKDKKYLGCPVHPYSISSSVQCPIEEVGKCVETDVHAADRDEVSISSFV